MKIKNLIAAIVLSCAFIIAPATFTGCTTASKTLTSTVQTVDGAMQGWATWVALGKSNPAEESKVKAAYEKYQASEAVAEAALLSSLKTGDKTGWQIAAATLRDNRTALLNLVSSLQSKK